MPPSFDGTLFLLYFNTENTQYTVLTIKYFDFQNSCEFAKVFN